METEVDIGGGEGTTREIRPNGETEITEHLSDVSHQSIRVKSMFLRLENWSSGRSVLACELFPPVIANSSADDDI